MITSNFPGGGVDIAAATAQPSHVRAPYTFFAGTNEQMQTGQIPDKAAQTYIPGTADQTIAAGQYLAGAQIIAGDGDLQPGNIKNGINLFGVAGGYTGVPWSATAGDTFIFQRIAPISKGGSEAGFAYTYAGAGYTFIAKKTGSYRFRFNVYGGTGGYYYADGYAILYKNGSPIAESEIHSTYQAVKTIDLALAENDQVALYLKGSAAGGGLTTAGNNNYFAASVWADELQWNMNNQLGYMQ